MLRICNANGTTIGQLKYPLNFHIIPGTKVLAKLLLRSGVAALTGAAIVSAATLFVVAVSGITGSSNILGIYIRSNSHVYSGHKNVKVVLCLVVRLHFGVICNFGIKSFNPCVYDVNKVFVFFGIGLFALDIKYTLLNFEFIKLCLKNLICAALITCFAEILLFFALCKLFSQSFCNFNNFHFSYSFLTQHVRRPEILRHRLFLHLHIFRIYLPCPT